MSRRAWVAPCDCASIDDDNGSRSRSRKEVGEEEPVSAETVVFNRLWRYAVQTEWRVACVRIPRFPIGAVWRAKRRAESEREDAQLLLTLESRRTAACSSTADRCHPEPLACHPDRSEGSAVAHWDDSHLVLTDGGATRPKLRTVSAASAREGVRAGMTLAEARALCGTLEVLPWDDVALNAAIMETTARFVQASPQVSPAAGVPGMWWIGASGFAPGAHTRAGGAHSERIFATALLAIARTWHPRARVAIADTCVAARAATWASASFGRSADERALVSIVPRGGDAAYLASAPLTLLPMDSEMRDALRALGVRTVGDFAQLEAGDVEQRWGDEGLTAWRLARGDDPRRPVLARPVEQLHVEMELGTAAATMEPVLFLVRPGVENLVTQLVSQGRSIASLAITLTLDDARGALPTSQAHTVTREIRLPRPLARPAPLFERCRGLLDRWTLTAPVTAVRLTVLLTSPLAGEQGNLLDTSWRDPGAADAALERVRAELGPNVVVKPHARDGYAVERSGEWRDGDESALGAQASNALSSPSPVHPSLRLLECAEKVDVDRDTYPRRIFWRGRAIPVANAVGPERLSGDWWNDGYSRDYWRCESDEECSELVLYRDTAGWWVQGWYD
jgi:protein ImuB